MTTQPSETDRILVVDDEPDIVALVAVSYTHLTLPTNREV